MKNLDENKMIYSIDELKKLNLSYYNINQLVANNILKKLTKKNYENLCFNKDFDDFVYINAYIPRGVVCLMSAAAYYHLTNTRVQDVDIAIYRNDKVSTVPNWPNIHLYYFSNDRYNVGIKTIKLNEDSFLIYDIDKTVADIIYYREKVGIEDTKELIKNYIRSNDTNLNNLMNYAKKLGCFEITKTYMEVLL